MRRRLRPGSWWNDKKAEAARIPHGRVQDERVADERPGETRSGYPAPDRTRDPGRRAGRRPVARATAGWSAEQARCGNGSREMRQDPGGEELGSIWPGRVREVDCEPPGTASENGVKAVGDLRRRPHEANIAQRTDAGLALYPLHVGLGLRDQNAHADDLHDLVVVAPDVLAVTLEHLLLVGIGLEITEAVVPPVGVLCDGAQQMLFAVTSHHHGRDRVRARLAVGARDLVVLAFVG